MEYSELIKNRYTVRDFKPDAIPQDILEKILTAGQLAPTACNKQPQQIAFRIAGVSCALCQKEGKNRKGNAPDMRQHGTLRQQRRPQVIAQHQKHRKHMKRCRRNIRQTPPRRRISHPEFILQLNLLSCRHSLYHEFTAVMNLRRFEATAWQGYLWMPFGVGNVS